MRPSRSCPRDPASATRTPSNAGLGPNQITLEATFIGDLGLDSLDAVEVTMAIEEEFNIELSDEEAESILSVKQAVEKIASKWVQYSITGSWGGERTECASLLPLSLDATKPSCEVHFTDEFSVLRLFRRSSKTWNSS